MSLRGMTKKIIVATILGALAAVLCLAAFFSLKDAEKAVDIGSRLELFLDEDLIENLTGAALRLHPPIPQEVGIVFDQPWEGNTSAYVTVFQDGDRFRMYYRGSNYDVKTDTSGPQVTCYAESRDAVHWTRPALGLFSFNGSKKNNIVWQGLGAHNFAAFLDTCPGCPGDERYKALGSDSQNKALFAFKSPDGIHWSLLQEKPIFPNGYFDSQNLAFWDTARNAYLEFNRGWKSDVRDIMISLSSDFRTWTEPQWLDYGNAPMEHLYTSAITPYFRAPYILVGFPKRFLPDRKVGSHKLPGVSDGLFMSSRDGRHWRRWGEAFLRPGLQRERWINRNNMIAWGILATKSRIAGLPDEISIYSSEGYYVKNCRLRRHTLRMDGFVSVNAPAAGGEMTTRPLLFKGSRLVLNFSTSAAGFVRAEVQDENGRALPGLGLADCPEVYGDEIESELQWTSGADLRTLEGKPVRLRFVLKDADLYSIRFR